MVAVLVSREDYWYGDLPPICVKTGEPAQQTIATSSEHIPPWTFLLLFAGILPFFIALLFARETVSGRVPVTLAAVEHYHAARRLVWTGWGIVLLGVAVAVAAQRSGVLWVSLAGLVVLVVAEVRRNRRWIATTPLKGTPSVEIRRVHPTFAAAVADARTTQPGSTRHA